MSDILKSNILTNNRFTRFIVSVLVYKKTKVTLNIINEKPEIIAIASPYFRGVKSSTKEMIPDLIEISDIYNRNRAKKLAKLIVDYFPKKVLISGYTRGYDLLAEELKKANPNLQIFALIHSAFMWFDVYPAENYVFQRFVELAKVGVVKRIGFCKRDLAEHFKKLGVDSCFVMNRFHSQGYEFKDLSKEKIKIGVFGQNMWHRNITNQVLGALQINKSEVHVNEISDHFFIDRARVQIHGILPKKEFLDLYKTLDINMYVSLTECFPMAVIESMQFGIPCLVSDTSDVYGWSPYLKKMLTVSTIDSPIGISKKIQEVINNYNDIQKEIKKYLPLLKAEIEKSIEEFIK